jgi:hypothetical protein
VFQEALQGIIPKLIDWPQIRSVMQRTGGPRWPPRRRVACGASRKRRDCCRGCCNRCRHRGHERRRGSDIGGIRLGVGRVVDRRSRGPRADLDWRHRAVVPDGSIGRNGRGRNRDACGRQGWRKNRRKASGTVQRTAVSCRMQDLDNPASAGNRSALDQGRRGLAVSGVLMVKTEPRPASERIAIEPPLFSTAARTTSIPTPRPDTGVIVRAVERRG